MKATTVATNQSLGVQATLVGAMAIWGLNVTVVKQLTGLFDTPLLAALRMVVAFLALTGILCSAGASSRHCGPGNWAPWRCARS